MSPFSNFLFNLLDADFSIGWKNLIIFFTTNQLINAKIRSHDLYYAKIKHKLKHDKKQQKA